MEKSLIEHIVSKLPVPLREPFLEINKDEISGRIVRTSFWALSGSVISKGFLLLASIIIARILGKSQFGELGIIQSTINMFAVIAGFGLGMTSTKYVAELRDSNPERTGNIIASFNLVAGIFGFCFTMIFIILSPLISEKLISTSQLTGDMRLGAVMLFFLALNGAQTGALAGFENFKAIAKINIIGGLVSLPVLVILSHFKGVSGAITGLGMTYFFLWIMNYVALRKTAARFNIKITIKRSLKDISFIWKFSLPAMLGGIIVSIAMWLSNTMLTSKTNGFNEMAIYNAASQWQNIVLFIPLAISQISLPLFSNSKHDIKKFVKLIKYNVLINLVVCSLLAIIFSVFSKFIMQSYGNSFKEGSVILIVLSVTAILISINSVIGQVIAGMGRMWIGLVVNIIWAITFLLIAREFIDRGYGAMGLAKAMFIAYLLHTIIVTSLSFFFLKRNSAHPMTSLPVAND